MKIEDYVAKKMAGDKVRLRESRPTSVITSKSLSNAIGQKIQEPGSRQAVKRTAYDLCRAYPNGPYQTSFRIRSSESDNATLQPNHHRVHAVLRAELAKDIADFALTETRYPTNYFPRSPWRWRYETRTSDERFLTFARSLYQSPFSAKRHQ